MEVDLKTRKQVNYDQMSGLLEFMQEHQDLAKGLVRGRRGKIHSLKLWNMCAKKLNPIKDGASKDGKGWSKYWCDWKYRVRRKALELKAAKDNDRPPPEGMVPMSAMEECIVGLIGDHAVEGVVIKTDPLADGEIENVDDNVGANDIAEPYEVSGARSSRRTHKRRYSREQSDSDGGEPSCPPERKPRFGSNDNDSDKDDHAAAFLKLEKANLDSRRRLEQALLTIANEISRLTEITTSIRDIINNRLN